MARNAQQLSEATNEISQLILTTTTNHSSSTSTDRQKIQDISVDISSDFETVAKSVREAVQTFGPVFILVNCAGFAAPKKFENSTIEEERRQMNVNYFGSTQVTRAVLPEMKSKAAGGHIVFVASQAGLIGLYGLSSYCASKFAVRGFAESLAMELAPFKIKVTVNCPPDTDTPGFAVENETKPEETHLISAGAGLFQPSVIARQLVVDTLEGKFFSTSGFDGWIATTLSSGLINSSFKDVITQSFLMGPLRFGAWFSVKQFYSIIQTCHNKRNQSKKTA